MKFFKNLRPHGSIYRDLLIPNVTSLLLSEKTLNFQRKIHKFKRGKKLPQLNIFIAVDDVQSFILLQTSMKLLERYQCRVLLHLLPIGVNGWSSSVQEKYGWINRDAGLFAAYYSLEEPHFSEISTENTTINTTQCEQVTSLIHNLLQSQKDHNIRTISNTLEYMRLIWGKNSPNEIPTSNNVFEPAKLKENQQLLKKLGYYNPGAIEMEGEWYPPGRLHHLERRLLSEEGLNQPLLFDKEQEKTRSFSTTSKNVIHENNNNNDKNIEVFYSFRSPYSQLVIPRLKKICSRFSCSITIRPLLPMVTRGLPVPPEKELYIGLDTAREARLWNIPFGKMIDPLHPKRIPFLRALDAFEVASNHGLGINFLESYGFHQWGNGVSAGTDYGLDLMMREAKMTDEQISHVFENLQKSLPEERFAYWEKKTASNRSYLLSRGLWGVPCLKYKEVILFGQDKMWAIEKLLFANEIIEKGEKLDPVEELLVQKIHKYGGL